MKKFKLLPIYLQKQPDGSVIAYHDRHQAKAKIMWAAWDKWNSQKPTRCNKWIHLNCWTWKAIWLKDAI